MQKSKMAVWGGLIVERREGKNTQKNYKKMIFITKIITMV